MKKIILIILGFMVLLGVGFFMLQQSTPRPTSSLQTKTATMQERVPVWISEHSTEAGQVDELLKEFGRLMSEKKFVEAEKVADEILELIGSKAEISTKPPGEEPVSYSGALIGPAQSVKLSKIPSSAEIIYHGDGHLYTMDRNGGNVTQITFGEKLPYEHAAVSYDRRYIVDNEHPKDAPGRSLLWLYDLKNGTKTQLTPDIYFAGDGGVDWDQIGFIYFKCKEQKQIQFSDVCKVKYDGTSFQQLTNTPNVEETDVAVSEDGTLVTYVLFVPEPEKNSAHTEIWIINSDGTNPRVVYRGGAVFKASVHDPEVSPDNKKVIFSKVNSEVPPNFPNNPGANTAHDIWATNLDGSGLTRLTKPGPISMIPDWEDNLIVYTEVSEKDKYAGASIANDHDIEQTPKRIKAGANAPKWIP